MAIEVTEEVEPELSRHKARCIVETVDAKGEKRRYEVSLTDDVINGRSILAGKRVDDHEYDRETPDSPTQAVYDAARSWFNDAGYPIQ